MRRIFRPAFLLAAVVVALLALQSGPVLGTALSVGSVPAPDVLSVDEVTSLIIDDESLMQDCTELVPESVSVRGVTDDGEELPLEVFVLIDVEEGAAVAAEEDDELREALMADLVARAYDAIAASEVSYDGIGVSLNYSGWDLLQPLDASGAPRERTSHAQEVIDLGKAHFGGERPDGFDIVYVLTDVNLWMPDIGDAVMGMADCIGGVRYPDRAFGVGQWGHDQIPDEGLPVGPITFYKDFTAKIAGHEIGHLMGAHHHYQSCGDAHPDALENGELGPCTLMTNAVDFQTFPFSQLSSAVVRGHTVDFAGGDDHDHGDPDHGDHGDHGDHDHHDH